MPVMESMAVAAMAMPYRPARLKAPQIAGTHREHRQRGGLHGDAEAGNDVGGMPGLEACRDMLHRAEFGGGVVLGDDDHHARQHEADQRAADIAFMALAPA